MFNESRCHELARLIMGANTLMELEALSLVFDQAVSVRKNEICTGLGCVLND